MANMSATILRNIVASTFNYPAQKIILSGEIAFDWIGLFSTNVAYMDVRDDVETLYSWTAKEGFKKVENCYSGNHFYNGNHDRDETVGNPLYEVATGEEVFFVLIHTHDKKVQSISLYKAPNFAQKWAEIEAEDVQRWNEWIS